eukprot:TRINITY_DN16816_c0_g1_i1.p1 TRINITY_DN16816_c0_g1~~TRINITY_DN16816_c0_g1_i1.p1  ORF type:complete len:775 (+),score=224.74 TRINITY_DN16816_c0_g1_i1:81-2405(+)
MVAAGVSERWSELATDALVHTLSWLGVAEFVSAAQVCRRWRDALSDQPEAAAAAAVLRALPLTRRGFGADAAEVAAELQTRAAAAAEAQAAAGRPPDGTLLAAELAAAVAWADHFGAAVQLLEAVAAERIMLGGLTAEGAAGGGGEAARSGAEVRLKRLLPWPREDNSPAYIACSAAVDQLVAVARIAAALSRWCGAEFAGAAAVSVAEAVRVAAAAEGAAISARVGPSTTLGELQAAGVTGHGIESACQRLSRCGDLEGQMAAVQAELSAPAARVPVITSQAGVPRLGDTKGASYVLRHQLLLLQALPHSSGPAAELLQSTVEQLREAQQALSCLRELDVTVSMVLCLAGGASPASAGGGTHAAPGGDAVPAALQRWQALVNRLCAESGGAAAVSVTALSGPQRLVELRALKSQLADYASAFRAGGQRAETHVEAASGAGHRALRARRSTPDAAAGQRARAGAAPRELAGEVLLLVARFIGGGLAESNATIGSVCREWRRRLRLAILAAAASPAELLEDAVAVQALSIRLPAGGVRAAVWGLALLTNEVVAGNGELLVTRQPEGAAARKLHGGVPEWLGSALPLTEAGCAALLYMRRALHGGGDLDEEGQVLELAPAVPVSAARAQQLAALHADVLRALAAPHYAMAETLHTNLLLWLALGAHSTYAEELSALVSLPHREETVDRALRGPALPTLLLRATQAVPRAGAVLRTLVAEAIQLPDEEDIARIASATSREIPQLLAAARTRTALGRLAHLLKFGAMHGNVQLWAHCE